MQVRGESSSWPHPYPGSALSPVSTPSSDQEPVVCCPTLPPPPLQPKGNKYKLYKVKGGPTLPWGGAAGRRRGRSAGQALACCCGQPHIIPSCSSVLA